MKITFTFYNHDNTDQYQIYVHKDNIFIKSAKGQIFVTPEELYEALDASFGHRLNPYME